MQGELFFKFPSTPHALVTPNTDLRIDKALDEDSVKRLFSSPITVEEKIDGANLGISFDSNGEIVLQNRGKHIVKPYHGQWKKLLDWVPSHLDALFNGIEDRYILFGEWCYAKHSILYTALPDWFIGFDLFEKSEERFLSVERRNILLNSMGISVVPIIGHGVFSKVQLPQLLRKSAFSDCECEGLYLRLDSENYLEIRAKYVRESFSQSINEHWSKLSIQHNSIKHNRTPI